MPARIRQKIESTHETGLIETAVAVKLGLEVAR